MNNCEQVQESLGAWLDDALSTADGDAVRRHLEGCADCRTAQSRLEKMSAVLHGALTADAGQIEFAPFWQALERRLTVKQAWYAPFQDWARDFFTAPRAAWAVPAAIAVTLVVISANSYFSGGRGGGTRNNFASVESIDAYGRNVALLREDDSKTTVIWLYQNQEGENEAAEEPPQAGPAF